MVAFPTALDTLTDPTSSNNLNTAGVLHADQHADLNNIAEALEAKVGIGASTPVANSLFAGTGTGTSSWSTGPTVSGTLSVGSLVVTSTTIPANGIYRPAADTLGLAVGSALEVQLTATALSPGANAGSALGTTALGWNGLHLATGTAINWVNGDVTITHSSNVLTVAGGTFYVSDTTRTYRTADPTQYMDFIVAGGSATIRSATGVPFEIGVDSVDFTINTNGTAFINSGANPTNANMTGSGLTINQGAGDDQILAFKSSDVGTGLTTAVTNSVEVDDYATFTKFASATGGLLMQVLGENAAVTTNFLMESYGGQADTTHTGAGRGLIELYASQHDGANALSDIAADGNVFAVRARRGAADVTLLIVDEDGNLFTDDTASTYDAYDDAALIRAYENPARALLTKGDELVQYNEADLVEAGILGAPRNQGGLLNHNRMLKLHSGAIWQTVERVRALEAENRQLRGALHAAGLLPERGN